MEAIIGQRPLSGRVRAMPSKSVAHRLIICAALSPSPTVIRLDETSRDIEATLSCVEALGCDVSRNDELVRIEPRDWSALGSSAKPPLLDCGESGSTLRFMLPVVCALGCGARITGAGRLSSRPLSPLYEELVAGGCEISRPGSFPLEVSGRLRPGTYRISGDVSSQFVTGLLLALPLLDGASQVVVSEPFESRPYVDLTIDAMSRFGVNVLVDMNADATIFRIPEGVSYHSCGDVAVEGDWSNAAFWLCAGAIAPKGSRTSVSGLDLASAQGDRIVLAALARLGARIVRESDTATVESKSLESCSLDVADIPDLVPPLAVACALAKGRSTLRNCGRLRLKESDRIESVTSTLRTLGAKVDVVGDDIVFEGVESLSGGVVDACGDHRIAMMAAIAATCASSTVTITNAEAVNKSYPRFFEDFTSLGGQVDTKEA